MEENTRQDREELFSKRVVAGNRTTYFFDVKESRNGDYYLTITESTRMRDQDGNFSYKKHRIFLHRESFGKFARSLKESMDFIKQTMDEVDFSEYENENYKPPSNFNGDSQNENDEQVNW